MTTPLLPRATPASQGVDAAVLARLVDRLGAIRDVHSLLVLRHGRVVAESWWAPFVPDEPHQLFSVSKSVTATAVGIAVAEGLLTVDDRVVDLLRDDVPLHPAEHLSRMRVRDLLTMTSGHDTESLPVAQRDRRATGSWVRVVLAAPVPHEPGSRFVYDTGATYLLSAILHRLTGQRLLDWLTPRLFAPLGIVGATWEQCPQGVDVGGYGLSLTTEQLAVLGELWRRRGRWGDRQLVPAAWVDAMTSAQVANGPTDPAGPGEQVDWVQGYGYQCWRCRFGAYRADGAFGQFCVVWPEHDLVAVLTGGSARTAKELTVLLEELGRACTTSAPSDDDAPDDDAPVGTAPLGTAYAPTGLAVARPVGAVAPPAQTPDGVVFALTPHPDAPVPPVGPGGEPAGSPADDRAAAFLRWHAVAVHHTADAVELRWTTTADGPWHVVRCGFHGWESGEVRLGTEPFAVAGAAAWTAPGTLRCRLLWRGTPFALDVVLRFDGERRVEVSVDQNVAFGPTALQRSSGHRAA